MIVWEFGIDYKTIEFLVAKNDNQIVQTHFSRQLLIFNAFKMIGAFI